MKEEKINICFKDYYFYYNYNNQKDISNMEIEKLKEPKKIQVQSRRNSSKCIKSLVDYSLNNNETISFKIHDLTTISESNNFKSSIYDNYNKKIIQSILKKNKSVKSICSNLESTKDSSN